VLCQWTPTLHFVGNSSARQSRIGTTQLTTRETDLPPFTKHVGRLFHRLGAGGLKYLNNTTNEKYDIKSCTAASIAILLLFELFKYHANDFYLDFRGCTSNRREAFLSFIHLSISFQDVKFTSFISFLWSPDSIDVFCLCCLVTLHMHP
jgi:hypothetical protein